MKVLTDIDVIGKRVFVRADLDVSVREMQVTNGERETTNAEVETSTRLLNLKPTVDWLLEQGARQIIIAGHIDRPKGKDPNLSTKRLLPILEKILGKRIGFSSQFTVDSSQLESSMNREPITDNRIALLENLRFWPGETANDPEFAQKLAIMADVYINEAFGVCHRKNASVVALPSLLPHAAGLHLQKEIDVLSKLLGNPQRPFVAIVGGAKIETKLPVIENLAKIADYVLVGGLIAKQLTIDNLQLTTRMSNVIKATSAPRDKDIDQKSIDKFGEVIASAKTVVWNGPMGIFEEGFENGTIAIAEAIIESGAYSIIGGGETSEFLSSKELISKFSFVSVGGGAMLEFLAGKKLPGIEVLS